MILIIRKRLEEYKKVVLQLIIDNNNKIYGSIKIRGINIGLNIKNIFVGQMVP